jgi:hypothetical protein
VSLNRGSNPCRGAKYSFSKFLAVVVDAIANSRRLHVPNIQWCLRPGQFLRFKVAQTWVRSQPCWFRALVCLKRANSPVSFWTPPRLLTALLRKVSFFQPLSNRIAMTENRISVRRGVAPKASSVRDLHPHSVSSLDSLPSCEVQYEACGLYLESDRRDMRSRQCRDAVRRIEYAPATDEIVVLWRKIEAESRCSASWRASDADYMPRLDALQRDKAVRNDGEEVLNPIRGCPNDQDGDSA